MAVKKPAKKAAKAARKTPAKSAVKKAASSETFKQVMTKAGNTPLATSPEEATTFAKSESDRFGQI